MTGLAVLASAYLLVVEPNLAQAQDYPGPVTLCSEISIVWGGAWSSPTLVQAELRDGRCWGKSTPTPPSACVHEGVCPARVRLVYQVNGRGSWAAYEYPSVPAGRAVQVVGPGAPPDLPIFADGFETGDPGRWSSVVP